MSIKHDNSDEHRPLVQRLAALCDTVSENGNLCIKAVHNPGSYEYVYLDNFEIIPSGQGHGTRFLTRLCNTADEHRIDLELKVLGHSEEVKRRLIGFYSRFGFRQIDSSHVMFRTAKRNRFKSCFLSSFGRLIYGDKNL